MRTKILIAITIFSLILSSSSCNKEPLSVTSDNKVEAKFIFVRNNKLIKECTLKSIVYDKSVDSTSVESTFYKDDLNWPYFILTDSLIHSSKMVGIGSRKKFEILYRIFAEDLKSYTFYKYISNDYTYGDTINNANQALEIFRWPEDTLRYIKIDEGFRKL